MRTVKLNLLDNLGELRKLVPKKSVVGLQIVESPSGHPLFETDVLLVNAEVHRSRGSETETDISYDFVGFANSEQIRRSWRQLQSEGELIAIYNFYNRPSGISPSGRLVVYDHCSIVQPGDPEYNKFLTNMNNVGLINMEDLEVRH